MCIIITLSKMFPTIFRPEEIYKLTQRDGAFRLAAALLLDLTWFSSTLRELSTHLRLLLPLFVSPLLSVRYSLGKEHFPSNITVYKHLAMKVSCAGRCCSQVEFLLLDSTTSVVVLRTSDLWYNPLLCENNLDLHRGLQDFSLLHQRQMYCEQGQFLYCLNKWNRRSLKLKPIVVSINHLYFETLPRKSVYHCFDLTIIMIKCLLIFYPSSLKAPTYSFLLR